MRQQRRQHDELFRDRARELRGHHSLPEAALWQQIRNGKLKGIKFRRQHPIGPYIVDFYCANAALVIELDGATHKGREEYDSVRQSWLEAQGLKVIRCSNHEFLDGLDALLELVWRVCCERTGKTNELEQINVEECPHPRPLSPERSSSFRTIANQGLTPNSVLPLTAHRLLQTARYRRRDAFTCLP